MIIDSNGLDGLARDFKTSAQKSAPEAKKVVSKGALNIKKRMQADARQSRHFQALAPTISYELKPEMDGVTAEIGPDKDRGGAASLAGIAYWGSSRPGGGTVTDPAVALEEETPNLIENLGTAFGNTLG